MLAPTELQVCLWLVFLKSKKLAPATIRTYLYTLSSEVKQRGGPAFLIPRGSWFIHATLKAITRVSPIKAPLFRRPITIPVLHQFLQALDFSTGDDLLYGVMTTVGVFGFLRINELCAVGKIGSQKFIRVKDVSFRNGHAVVSIYNTKTKDIVEKVLANLTGYRCNPCGLLWSFINARGPCKPDGPLFINQKGKPVTRVMFLDFLRKVLVKVYPSVNPKEWNGASLRKGGATSAVKAGVHSEVIERLGHWDSDAYKRYIHCSVHDITKAQAECARLTGGTLDTYL